MSRVSATSSLAVRVRAVVPDRNDYTVDYLAEIYLFLALSAEARWCHLPWYQRVLLVVGMRAGLTTTGAVVSGDKCDLSGEPRRKLIGAC
jgi:hypothetical protein